MLFSEIYKKGYGPPSPSDLLEGGFGVDVSGKKGYSKGTDGTIFQLGLTDDEIQAIADAITAAEDKVDTVMPLGAIILWSGTVATIPSGWALCDGSNGTPDLVGRFIYGANSNNQGDIGGNRDAIVPSHNHTFSGNVLPGHTHQVNDVAYASGKGTNGVDNPWAATTNKTTTSVSAGTPSGTISTVGVSVSNANLPPYMKLAYIQRIS